MLLRDPLLCAVAAGGFLQSIFVMARQRFASPSLPVLLFPTISLLAGLAVIPTRTPQYMLLVLPAGAVLGAQFIWTLVSEFRASGHMAPGDDAVASLTVATLFVIVAAVGLYVARPYYFHPAAYPDSVSRLSARQPCSPGVGGRSGPLWSWSVRCRCTARNNSVGCGVCRMARHCARCATSTRSRSRPTACWMASPGWRGFGRTRRSTRSFMVEFAATLHIKRQPKVVEILASCDERPKLVLLDDDLRALSAAVVPRFRGTISRRPMRSSGCGGTIRVPLAPSA